MQQSGLDVSDVWSLAGRIWLVDPVYVWILNSGYDEFWDKTKQ